MEITQKNLIENLSSQHIQIKFETKTQLYQQMEDLK